MAKYLLDTNICVFFLRGNKSIVEQIINNGIDNGSVPKTCVSTNGLTAKKQKSTL